MLLVSAVVTGTGTNRYISLVPNLSLSNGPLVIRFSALEAIVAVGGQEELLAAVNAFGAMV